MSWEEVKKINSDMMTPIDSLIKNLKLNNSGVYLSDKMGYIRGIIPRGAVKKEVKAQSGTANGNIVSISGKGMLYYTNSYLQQHGDSSGNCSLTCYIDESMPDEKKTITFSGRYSVPIGFQTDVDSLETSEGFDISGKTITISNKRVITNKPIFFSKSLRVVSNSDIPSYQDTDVIYYLFP